MDLIVYLFNFPTLAMLIGGLAIAFFGYLVTRSKKNQTPKSIAICSLIAGILVVIGGVMASIQQIRSEESLQIKTDSIEKLSERNTELSLQIADLAKRNADLNRYIASSLTGGDSFCYYVLFYSGVGKDIINRMLTHVGQYPLYDLHIRIVDSNKTHQILEKEKQEPGLGAELWKEIEEKAEERIQKPTFFKIGQGSLGTDIFEYFQLPPDENRQKYSIFFTARNGEWHQRISFRRVEGKWIWASRVTKLYEKKTILTEQISSGFPRTSDGEIDW